MKKWINILCGLLLSLFTIYFIAVNFINVVWFHKMSWTLDLRLMFFNDQSYIFILLTMLVVLAWSEIIINNLFGKNRKRRLTGDEKNRTSHLASFKEIRPSLIRLDFDENGFIETKKFNLEIKKNKHYKSFHDFEKISQSFIKDRFKLNVPPKIPILTNYNSRHPVLKQYSIGDAKQYRRAGLVFTGGKNYMYVDPTDSHTLVIGTSNSGKSWSLVLEMLEACRMAGESVVVNDPKGELTKYVKKKFEDDGYQCYVLNFVDPEFSNAWNPFELAIEEWKAAEEAVRGKIEEQKRNYNKLKNKYIMLGLEIPKEPEPIQPDYSKAIEMIIDVANTLCLEANPKDPIWTETARDMVAGAACFLLENGDYDLVNFTNIYQIASLAREEIRPENDPYLISPITKKTKIMELFMNRFKGNNDYSKKLFDSYIKASDDTASSFYSTFKNKINLVTQNKAVEKILASNEIVLKKIGEKKTAIFLIVHDEKKTYYPISTMFVKQTYEALVKSARNETGLRLKVPLNMILDEFGNMPPVKDIDAMLTAARSRGIRLTMIVQDFQQLNKQYGKEMATTIKGNVMNTVYLLSGANETLEEISKSAGTEKVWNKDKKLYEDVRLFSTDKLKHFKMGEALFLAQRKHPYFTKLPPYDDYSFFKGGLESKFDIVDKPEIKYYDLKDDFAQRCVDEAGMVFDDLFDETTFIGEEDGTSSIS